MSEEKQLTKSEFKEINLVSVEGKSNYELDFSTFAQLEKFALFMAKTNFVAKCLRNKPEDCLVALMNAKRWGMDPFAVASKVYFVNDIIAYEAQLVDAVVNSSKILEERLTLEFTGEGEGLKCKVTGHIKGEKQPKTMEYDIKPITTRNSPLWKQQPKQQFGYWCKRAWNRMYCPDVIMGVYTKDEIENGEHEDRKMVDVTPKAPVQPITLETINQVKAQTPQPTPVVKETLITEFDAVAFQNILDDIATVPTMEGLQFKYDHAVAEFHEAPTDKYRELVSARDKREVELQNVAASEAVIEPKQEMPAFFGKSKPEADSLV